LFLISSQRECSVQEDAGVCDRRRCEEESSLRAQVRSRSRLERRLSPAFQLQSPESAALQGEGWSDNQSFPEQFARRQNFFRIRDTFMPVRPGDAEGEHARAGIPRRKAGRRPREFGFADGKVWEC